MPYGTLNADTITNSNGLSGNAIGPGFKNRIINGDMRTDQRNAGASVTCNDSSGFAVDRFFGAEIGNGAFTLQQVTDAPAGFVNSLKMTVTTPQTGTLNAGIGQSIEGFNTADFSWGTASAKTVTISFWVKSSVTGAMGGAIQNSAQNRSYPFNYTVSTSDAWEQKSITIAGDTSGTWLTNNGTGLILRFMFGTSLTGTANTWAADNYRAPTGSVFPITTSGATWFVTGVQLEVAPSATSFDYRPYGTELMLCQRYYYRFNPAGSGENSLGTGFCDSTTVAQSIIFFPVTMRTAPTALEQSGTAANYEIRRSGGAATACSSVPAFVNGNVQNGTFNLTVASGLTAGQAIIGRAANTSAYLAWSAEL